MRPRSQSVELFLIVLALILIGALSSIQSQTSVSDSVLTRLRTQIKGRDLATQPPRVDTAQIERLLEPTVNGNAVLTIRFAKDEQVPSRLDFDGGDRIATLVDDGTGVDRVRGDGEYSALGRIDFDAFGRAVRRWGTSNTAQPLRTFDSRAKVVRDARLDRSILQPGVRVPWEWWGDPTTIDAERSLLVRDPLVVQDPTRTRASCGGTSMGRWSFGYLMEQMANTPVTGVTGSELTKSWLESWASDQTVNGWTVSSRARVNTRLLDPWIAASGGPLAPLDLAAAPFRLLAIVNRVDLRGQSAYGSGDAGELRFVFTAVGADCHPLVNFTVIFEFGVSKVGCLDAQAWARRWKDLDTLPIGSLAYNAALEALTEQVVAANANPLKVNGSALNQLRTNENAFDTTGDGLDWELREFRLSKFTHRLHTVTVAQTPQSAIRFSSSLGTFVNANAADITGGTHVVPLAFPGAMPFRGGVSRYVRSAFWDATTAPAIVDRSARHRFSLATCNGCHAAETDTEFMHVRPAAFGVRAELSGFMTGTTVLDPADHAPSRFFNDLERRETDLDGFISQPCFVAPLPKLLRATH